MIVDCRLGFNLKSEQMITYYRIHQSQQAQHIKGNNLYINRNIILYKQQ